MPPTTSKGLKPVIVYLSPKDYEAIQREAQTQGSSASQVIRSIVRQWADATIPSLGRSGQR